MQKREEKNTTIEFGFINAKKSYGVVPCTFTVRASPVKNQVPPVLSDQR